MESGYLTLPSSWSSGPITITESTVGAISGTAGKESNQHEAITNQERQLARTCVCVCHLDPIKCALPIKVQAQPLSPGAILKNEAIEQQNTPVLLPTTSTLRLAMPLYLAALPL